ncbi:MAG TPA: hypothetical protein VM554_02015 [Acidisarcina sp.]|nr:hypothetical protein [Acidisarcina sp.]
MNLHSSSPGSEVQIRLSKAGSRSTNLLLVLLLLLPGLAGCGKFRRHPKNDIVYVMVKQTYLRDRVAALSNRVAPVVNGQRLEIVERGRRFLKVKTEKNEIGWIEERAVIDDTVYEGFQDLRTSHEKDPVIATGVLRDELYAHLTPGRDTARFFLLPEGEKLQLLVRASVPKPQSPLIALPKPVATPLPHKGGKAAGPEAKAGVKKTPNPAAAGQASPGQASPGQSATGQAATGQAATAATEAPPPPLEDWWLVRSSQGKVGWLLARRVDVDVPEAIAGYAEGQKIVGSYVLATVQDLEASTPDKMVPEYVTVLNAYKDGLPYDFDQVRVFTWNTKKHRYETAYRQRSLQGFLPIEVGKKAFDNQGPVPYFSFRQATGDQIAVDPATGIAKPGQTETLTFRMDGVMVKRVGPPGQPVVTRQAEKAKSAAHAPGHPSGHRKSHKAAR